MGKANSGFEQAVRNGTLEGITFEGCVCKGKNKSPGRPWMFKIKTKAWIDKLKAECDNEEMFQELL